MVQTEIEHEEERERERQLHRAQLRTARVRATRTRQARVVATAIAAGAIAGGIAAYVLIGAAPDRGSAATLSGTVTLDDLYLRGSLHVLDDAGREVALLGREAGQARGPVVLGLYSPADGDSAEQTLRLATSESGSAISLRSPEGDSSITLFAGRQGPEVALNRGASHRVISEQPEVVPAPAGTALPAVAAGTTPSSGPHLVQLTQSAVQSIGHGFMVSKLEATPHPNGVRVKGRVINTTSVAHKGLSFRIALGEHSQAFGINLISPGNSTGFWTVVRGASLEGSPPAEIEYLASTVTYQGHSLRGHDGAIQTAN